MIQRLDVVKQELAQTMADKETWGQFQAARAEMRAKAEERKAVRDQLDALRGELEQTYQSILKLSAERREQFKEREARRERAPPSERRSGGDFRGGDFQERRRQREEERKEMEPYLKEIDPFVSMDEIAEIKKKPKGGEESASAEGSQAAE